MAVETFCPSVDRYHTTDEQRAAAKKDPATWYSLFQWLYAFDLMYDKHCRVDVT